MTRFWHGLGPCGDATAVTVLYPANTRGEALRDGVPREWGDYVYLTPVEAVARAFSALAGGHAVAEVDVDEAVVEPDPDFVTLGVRVKGPVEALSVSVLEQPQMPTAREIAQALAVDAFWPDGQPRYTPDGYFRLPPGFDERGYTEADFRWLGKWWPMDFLVPADDDRIIAITNDLHCYSMYPEGHPEVQGRRRIPAVAIDDAWTGDRGYCPPLSELFGMLQIIGKWEPERFKSLTHSPWD
ncbi:hypothetical protein [Mycobacteroides abscessus]|uniref:hypothetical protein n=1 Tax=Mycobacteroides abscessus TaxID=36809 RepID=UPI0011C42CBC|nr:hypothetical protein [Mycobacteroides abscessus]